MVTSNILRSRAALLHALRKWFWENGYLEVQTPIRVKSPAMEPYLELSVRRQSFCIRLQNL